MNVPIEFLHAEQMHTIVLTLTGVSGAVTARKDCITLMDLASV